MVAFVGIIVHQLYNIIVNGGSPSKSDEEPIGEDECPVVDDDIYPACMPVGSTIESLDKEQSYPWEAKSKED